MTSIDPNVNTPEFADADFEADADVETLANEVLGQWGQPFCNPYPALVEGIETLYRTRLTFPKSWPEERREAFITYHADIDGTELSDRFDDLVDTTIDGYGQRNGVLLHPEDAAVLIDVARRVELSTLLTARLESDLPAAIAQSVAKDAY
jgi:hypothetical protein